jgi:hypothetical protein
MLALHSGRGQRQTVEVNEGFVVDVQGHIVIVVLARRDRESAVRR